MATTIKVSVSDIMRVFDLDKLNIVGVGHESLGMRMLPATNGDDGLNDTVLFLIEDQRLPAGKVVNPDFKFHSDGSITLLRVGDVDVQDD